MTDALRRILALAALALLGGPGAASGQVPTREAAAGQALADRIAAAPDGVVRLSFTARPGVCGNGTNIVTHSSDEHWVGGCEEGPVRVLLTLRDGAVVRAKTFVGGRWRPVPGMPITDLGRVPAPAAASYLIGLAAEGEGAAARNAILPATLADSASVLPALLQIARQASRPLSVRKAALFWVGQAAGEAAAEGLEHVATDVREDRVVRRHAVFALSTRPADEGVPALIRLAREHGDPEVRKSAVFWLAQSADPRAISFFEELLLSPH